MLIFGYFLIDWQVDILNSSDVIRIFARVSKVAATLPAVDLWFLQFTSSIHRRRMWILIRPPKFCPSCTWAMGVTLAIWPNSTGWAFHGSSTWRPISPATSTSSRAESSSNNCRQPIPASRISANISTTPINSSVKTKIPFSPPLRFFAFLHTRQVSLLRHNDSRTQTHNRWHLKWSWLTHTHTIQWNRRKLDFGSFFLFKILWEWEKREGVCVCVLGCLECC